MDIRIYKWGIYFSAYTANIESVLCEKNDHTLIE